VTHHAEEACNDLKSLLRAVQEAEVTVKAKRVSKPRTVTKRGPGRVPLIREVGGRKAAKSDPATPIPRKGSYFYNTSYGLC